MKIKFNSTDIEITYKYDGEDFDPWGDKLVHNKFKVIVKNGKIRKSFDFYDSNYNWEIGKREWDCKKLAEAFNEILDDALMGQLTYEDFVDELGYEDPKEAYRVWIACQNSYLKLGLKPEQIYDLMEEIEDEKYECSKE